VERRESAVPDNGAEVAVARLDGAGGERTDAAVARFGAVLQEAPGHATADLTGLTGDDPESGPARVAAFGEGPAGGAAPGAPVAQFGAQQLDVLRDDIRVAELERGTRRRDSRRECADAGPEGEDVRRGGRARSRRPAGRDGGPRSPEGPVDDPTPAVPEIADPGGVEKARSRRGRSRTGSQELDPDADPIAVAKEICLRLLADRARTRQELAQALRRKGIPDEAAGAVLERFDEVGLIDDAAFAGQWVRSRHAYRGLARRAIAFELRRKGVSDEDAGEALAEVDVESEERRARELVDRKLRTLTVATADQRSVAARRLVGMLARKGYGAGVAYRVVKEALAERGADVEEELGGVEPADG
jgi:regulatory protein